MLRLWQKRRQPDATMHSLRYRFPRKRGLIIALRPVSSWNFAGRQKSTSLPMFLLLLFQSLAFRSLTSLRSLALRMCVLTLDLTQQRPLSFLASSMWSLTLRPSPRMTFPHGEQLVPTSLVLPPATITIPRATRAFRLSVSRRLMRVFLRLDSRFSRLFLARFSAVLSTRDCQLSRNTGDFRAMRLFRQCLRFMMQTLTWYSLVTQMLLRLRGSALVSLSRIVSS